MDPRFPPPNFHVYVGGQVEAEGSEPRRHHHKKRRRHRDRSSSSESPEPRRLHINPALANSIADARGVQERFSFLEIQVQNIGAELTSSLARINVLENELRMGFATRQSLEAQCGFLRDENAGLQRNLADSRMGFSTLEQTIASVRNEKLRLERDTIEAETKRKAAEEARSAALTSLAAAKMQEQFVAKRNEILVKKCEELCEKAKAAEHVREEAEKKAALASLRAERDSAAASQALQRAVKAEAECAELKRENEAHKPEKTYIQKQLLNKEKELLLTRRQMEAAEKEAHTRYEELLQSSRQHNSAVDTDAGVTVLQHTLLKVREELSGQLNSLRGCLGLPELHPPSLQYPTSPSLPDDVIPNFIRPAE